MLQDPQALDDLEGMRHEAIQKIQNEEQRDQKVFD